MQQIPPWILDPTQTPPPPVELDDKAADALLKEQLAKVKSRRIVRGAKKAYRELVMLAKLDASVLSRISKAMAKLQQDSQTRKDLLGLSNYLKELQPKIDSVAAIIRVLTKNIDKEIYLAFVSVLSKSLYMELEIQRDCIQSLCRILDYAVEIAKRLERLLSAEYSEVVIDLIEDAVGKAYNILGECLNRFNNQPDNDNLYTVQDYYSGKNINYLVIHNDAMRAVSELDRALYIISEHFKRLKKSVKKFWPDMQSIIADMGTCSIGINKKIKDYFISYIRSLVIRNALITMIINIKLDSELADRISEYKTIEGIRTNLKNDVLDPLKEHTNRYSTKTNITLELAAYMSIEANKSILMANYGNEHYSTVTMLNNLERAQEYIEWLRNDPYYTSVPELNLADALKNLSERMSAIIKKSLNGNKRIISSIRATYKVMYDGCTKILNAIVENMARAKANSGYTSDMVDMFDQILQPLTGSKTPIEDFLKGDLMRKVISKANIKLGAKGIRTLEKFQSFTKSSIKFSGILIGTSMMSKSYSNTLKALSTVKPPRESVVSADDPDLQVRIAQKEAEEDLKDSAIEKAINRTLKGEIILENHNEWADVPDISL